MFVNSVFLESCNSSIEVFNFSCNSLPLVNDEDCLLIDPTVEEGTPKCTTSLYNVLLLLLLYNISSIYYVMNAVLFRMFSFC